MAGSGLGNSLKGSWVELSASHITEETILNERLLMDAQREGSISTFSRTPGRTPQTSPTPISPCSPPQLTLNPQIINSSAEWVYDWSSRPDIVPPRGYGDKFKHPINYDRSKYTYSSKSSIFSWESLPSLLASHAAAVFLGASVMYLWQRFFRSGGSQNMMPNYPPLTISKTL